jgi:hypothetical protein
LKLLKKSCRADVYSEGRTSQRFRVKLKGPEAGYSTYVVGL